MDETYTAEQLRERARNLRVNGHPMGAHECEAHADALEENARLTRECEFHAKQCARVDELRHRAEAELAKFTQAVGLATTIKGEMPIRPDDPIGMMHEVVEAASKLREERAKLRQHAEAMAEHWEKDDTMNMMQSAVDAYRRDYPEGTK